MLMEDKPIKRCNECGGFTSCVTFMGRAPSTASVVEQGKWNLLCWYPAGCLLAKTDEVEITAQKLREG